MKIILSALVLILAGPAFAGNGPFTLGAILGDPTGLSGKLDLENDTAVDGALSWSSGTRTGLQIHSDYLKYQPGRVRAGDTNLDLYYGIGGRLITLNSGKEKGKLSVGPRAPLGLKHEIRDPSIEFFGEAALILDLVPSTVADIDLGIGLRYRF